MGASSPAPLLIQKVSRAAHTCDGAKQHLSGAHPVPSLLRTATQVEVSTHFTGIEVRQQEELTARLQSRCLEESSHRLGLFPRLLCGVTCASPCPKCGHVYSGSSWLGRRCAGRETLSFRRKIALSLPLLFPSSPLFLSPAPKFQGKCVCGYLNLQPGLQKVLPQPENLWMKK